MAANIKGTILIIEDEPVFRRIYKDFLETEGYKVLEAEDGEKGLNIIRNERPDLVLLDIVVPSLSGFDILKKMRSEERTKEIPVIIFSVLGEKDTIKKALELGANDFAVKGFYSPGEILSKIRGLLTKANIRKHMVSYLLGVQEARADAAKLEQDMGMTKLLQCPHCNSQIFLELLPDYSRTDGHWFISHFVCPECKRSF
jgi:DNA-binding response OmpR family regulator